MSNQWKEMIAFTGKLEKRVFASYRTFCFVMVSVKLNLYRIKVRAAYLYSTIENMRGSIA
jgi:hypothetical protein